MKCIWFVVILSCSLIGVLSDFPTYQCFEEIDFCRCLRPDGTTSAGPSKTLRTCDCYAERDTQLKKSQSDGAIGVYIPICNEDGTYAQMQCDVWQGHCWCSDEKGNNVSVPIQGSPQYEGLC